MAEASRFHLTPGAASAPLIDEHARLWDALMMARVMLAVAVLAAHLDLDIGNVDTSNAPEWARWTSIGIAYLLITLATRFLTPSRYRTQLLDTQWLHICGVDIAYIGLLVALQPGSINYAPLMVLPVLLASVLGSRTLALSTATLAALALIGIALVTSEAAWDLAPGALYPAAFAGIGLLAVAWLTSYLVRRASLEQQAARNSHRQAQLQRLASALVMETLDDGILVVDSNLVVLAANPAARTLLRLDDNTGPFALDAYPAWQPLTALTRQALTASAAPAAPQRVNLHAHQAPLAQLLVRTACTAPADAGADRICVLFLQDVRALQAQMRAEKLAAMGRMSAAVAHELRNPLAAISQANALLEEEPDGAAQKQLRHIVSKNTLRLQRIIADILDVTQVPTVATPPQQLALDATVRALCAEWCQQHQAGARVALDLQAEHVQVQFSRDHMHRLLGNLLDNAARYASQMPAAIVVCTRASSHLAPLLRVWSDGAPLEPGVQRHLFEPFFSSESRSSGLGLFLCRELCDQHEATLTYERRRRPGTSNPSAQELGNAFDVRFRSAAPPDKPS